MEVLSDNMGSETGSKKTPFDDLNREELIKKCKGLLGIAQKSKQAKIELQTEIESYKLQLEKSESEKESSHSQVITLQELVNSLTEQKLNYITEIDSAQSKVKFLTGTCKKLEEEIANYKSELIVKNEKITEISAQLSNFDSENTSLKRQNKRINEENEQLLDQLTELETKIEEFNQIGLQQREQLQLLEEKVNSGKPSDYDTEIVIEGLNARIKDLESELLKPSNIDDGSQKQISNYEEKIKEITQLYENEKDKKEKANVKLRSYKDKISKCALCINQLKNTRYILTKTVKEYSESIPKWQKDIIKASKFLETNINELSNENNVLKVKLQELEKKILNFTGPKLDKDNEVIQINTEKEQLQQQLADLTQDNDKLANELANLKPKYEHLKNTELPAVKDENKVLEHQITELTHKVNDLSFTNVELSRLIQEVETNNKKLNQSLQALQNKTLSGSGNMENLVLQIKSLESEKAILVKEKMNAKDSLLDVENQNKQLANQVQRLTTDLNNINAQYETLKQKNELEEKNTSKEILAQLHELKCEKIAIQECYEMLKKEHENQVDLNGLLRDEVETLKLSLEQPKDDNLSDLNVSLQADVVKLENKLSAYKQENASLLSEVKESRAKLKEVNTFNINYEDVKSKLASYKSENTELLNEMKEINQVLKERGEAISKLEKAISEMERLIETLEKDREAGKHEKEKLLKKISSLQAELQNVELTSNQNSEATKKIIAEKDDANKSVAEKNAIISTLQEEIEKLKQHQNAPTALPIDDNMSTSTTSKFEEHSQMKDLDDSFEEKYTKLRIFALKLKKKLNETTVQLQNSEQDKAKLEKIINEQSNSNKIQAHDEVDSPRSKEDNVQKVDFTELEGRVKSLTAELEASKNLAVELENLKADLAAKCQQLLAETEAHKATQDSLEKARRDVKKRSVLSLEMEDYEKSMKDLTHKMEDNVKKMQQMESTIDTQEGTITAMKTQIKLLEEQIKAEETQNRLTKEELQRVVEESKEKDYIINTNNGIISKLELDLEDEKRKSEETNIEMTSLFAEKEKVIIGLGEEKLELNNRLKKIEFKCADLEEKLKNTNIELEDLKTDYTSYKVRAQSVLRQNQTVDHSQEELLKEETAAMKSQVEVLTAKLNTLQEKCSELQSCCDVERRRASEAAGEAARAGQRTARLQADLARLAAQLDAERGQHKLQVSTLTQCYKTQIADLEAKLQKETEELKRQLAEKEKPPAILDKINSNTGAYMLPVIPKEEGSDGEMDINVSMLPREEGEGSESAPSPPLSKSFLGGGNRSPVPLERLLDEGVPEDEALESASLALSPEQELGDVRRKLSAQQERVKHVTLLLAESERECARYAQMNELLKAEVRRARGSLERTEHAHNAEYMKNVTLKFVTLPPGDERSRLVPVLQKILTLTPEETHKINAVAKGMDPNPGKGWGSYLHWPGGK